MKKNYLEFVFIFLLFISAIYGSTYELFKNFDSVSWDAFSDSSSYIHLAENPSSEVASDMHPYRRLVPVIVHQILKIDSFHLIAGLLQSGDYDEHLTTRLGFYLVNSVFIIISAYFLLKILIHLGVEKKFALIGSILFLSSRPAVYSTAVPIIDASYFLGLMILFYIVLVCRGKAVLFLIPPLMLIKEIIFPLAAAALMLKRCRTRFYVCILILSFCVLVLGRLSYGLQILDPASSRFGVETLKFGEMIWMHLQNVLGSLQKLLSMRGIHDLTHGFSLILALSSAGIYQCYKVDLVSREIFWFFCAIMGVSFFLALMSGNLGRLFFSAYLPVIFFAMVGLKHCIEES